MVNTPLSKVYQVVNNEGETELIYADVKHAKRYIKNNATPNRYRIVEKKIDREVKQPTISELNAIIKHLKHVNGSYKINNEALIKKNKILMADIEVFKKNERSVISLDMILCRKDYLIEQLKKALTGDTEQEKQSAIKMLTNAQIIKAADPTTYYFSLSNP